MALLRKLILIKIMKYIKLISIACFAIMLAILWIPAKLTEVLLEPLVSILGAICNLMDEVFEQCGTLMEKSCNGK